MYAQTLFSLHNTQFCVTKRTLMQQKIVSPTQKVVTHFTQFFHALKLDNNRLKDHKIISIYCLDIFLSIFIILLYSTNKKLKYNMKEFNSYFIDLKYLI